MLYLPFCDIQLPCIISTPNGERLNGSIRQCFTTGQFASQHWKSAARLFHTLPAAQQSKTVSKPAQILSNSLIFVTYLCSEVSNGSENQNSIVSNSMHHTGDQISYVVSSHSKNYLDSYRGSPAHTTTSMGTGMNSTITAPTLLTTQTPLMKLQQNTNQPQLQQLLVGSVKNPQFQLNDVAQNQNVENLQQQENSHNLTFPSAIVQKGQQSTVSPAMPMSSILRSQLEELKHMPHALGSNLLSNNEQQLCKMFNLPPTTYLSLKTILLSGVPTTASNLSPVESSLRKYFVKVGWLSH